MLPLIYIAGPFRGPTPWHVAENVRAAERVAFEVAHAGAMPVCPHTMTAHFDGQLDGQFWVDGTLALLARCDAMVVQGEYWNSVGTAGEIVYAEDNKMPTFYTRHSDWWTSVRALVKQLESRQQ